MTPLAAGEPVGHLQLNLTQRDGELQKRKISASLMKTSKGEQQGRERLKTDPKSPGNSDRYEVL